MEDAIPPSAAPRVLAILEKCIDKIIISLGCRVVDLNFMFFD